MPIRITVQPSKQDAKRLQEALNRLAKTGRSLRRPLGRIGLFVRREAIDALRRRRHTWGPTSGRLMKSLAMEVNDRSVVVGSNLVYAAIQQLGGEVRPKGHKYLAIPVLPHLRRRGVWPRDLPKDSMKFVHSAAIRIGSHSWTGPALVRAQDTEIGTSMEGAGLSAEAGGKKRKSKRLVRKAGEVMFALIKQARIRGRPYLQFSPSARAFALAELKREYIQATRGR